MSSIWLADNNESEKNISENAIKLTLLSVPVSEIGNKIISKRLFEKVGDKFDIEQMKNLLSDKTSLGFCRKWKKTVF